MKRQLIAAVVGMAALIASEFGVSFDEEMVTDSVLQLVTAAMFLYATIDGAIATKNKAKEKNVSTLAYIMQALRIYRSR